MEIELYIKSGIHWSQIYFRCPLCKFFGDEEEYGLTYQDYVDYPMLWCESCGAREVMDPASFKSALVAFDQIAESHTGPHVDIDRSKPMTESDMHPTSFKIPLLFIERLSDYRMSDYRSVRPLTPDEMKELTESYDYKKFNNSYDPEVVKKLGLVSSDYYYKNEFNEGDYATAPKLMNISVPVNSYDAFSPSVPFVGNVDLRHGGVYIFLQVKELDGSSSTIRFWGD